MGEKTLNIRIKNKYDTEANWTKNNPVLLAGETAYSSDRSGKYKIGDGTHKWSELSYAKADLVKSDVTTALGYTPPTNNTWRGIQNNLTSDSATDSLAAAQGKVLKGLVDGKLPLTGGTMNGTAMITWPDSGNWSNSNKDVTFPVVRGGLSWNGQSDGIQLYAVETGNDNLELYLKFTDDNSNGLSIRNNKNTQTARIAADGTITASSFVGNLNGTASAAPWSGITGKPTSYPPSSHTHNYAGSSSAGGSATSAVKLDTATAGSTTQPVYFSGGKPSACTYTLGKSVPSNAVFTDTNTKVTQTAVTSSEYTNWRTIPWGASNSGTEGFTPTTVTDSMFSDPNLTYQPSTGTLKAKIFKGSLSGNASTASNVAWTGVTGRPSSMPASDVYAWAKASSKPSYSKSEIGLGNVDNTADSAKSVKYATSAGSANAVAWANVSGKPAITGKQTRTLTASGPSGWKDATTDQAYVPDMAFMAYWNGAYSGSSSNLAYCNRGAFGTIVTKNTGDYATASHTHNYAGSSSAGGNANAAVKLATARTINGTSFDGSANITTANWGTARTIGIGNTSKSVNGSANVSWSLAEIGVHVSTSEPTASDGQNGDIWIVYE